MTLDAKARQTAFRLVEKLGKSITWTKIEESGEPIYNPNTGLFEANSVSIAYSVKVEPPYSPTGEELQSGQYLATDLKFLLPALGLAFEPRPNDIVIIDSLGYTVKTAQPFYSGELLAYYNVVVTR